MGWITVAAQSQNFTTPEAGEHCIPSAKSNK
jgi:hypothetical protein